ncbi:MAG: TIGR03067 domain-containing protein [Opitutaceae bacterium]|nr:TIGR03067 domain-containing protein [Verrucomicrobiales bacterium]
MMTLQIRSSLFVALAVVAYSVTVRAEENPSITNELAQLQGTWSMVSGSADGQPMPAEMLKQMKRVCKGDETTTTMGGQVFMKAKFTIDPSKKPKTIDYQMIEGFTKGKKQLGVYEVDGDTFKSCFGAADAERPKDFTSQPGDKRTSSVWKREKETAPKSK